VDWRTKREQRIRAERLTDMLSLCLRDGQKVAGSCGRGECESSLKMEEYIL